MTRYRVIMHESANVLHVQQWTSQWETIDTIPTDSPVLPPIDLHPSDVGEGRFRLMLTNTVGDVLAVSDEVELCF